MNVQLHHGDCLDILKTLDAGSVDAIITSPPYSNQREGLYEGAKPSQYIDWFMPRADEMQRLLRDDGTFILNIKERVVAGERSTYVLELILEMRRQGWLWTEEFIWHKKSAYPGKWPNRFRDAWERLLQFNKQSKFKMYQDSVMVPAGEWGRKRLKKLSQRDLQRVDNGTGNGFGMRRGNWTDRPMVYPSNVLHMASETRNQGHPAAFPVSLPEWFAQLFTRPGDTILDPFMGSGTTGVACIETGRNFVGIEKDAGYFDIATKRIEEARMQLPLLEAAG